MTTNAVIKNALQQFGYPCSPNTYEGEEKRYFTFDSADERGTDFGDDEPSCIAVDMQVHFFLPIEENGAQINYLQLKKQVREALFSAGFTYPEVTETTEPENNIRHLIYECEITEEREEN